MSVHGLADGRTGDRPAAGRQRLAGPLPRTRCDDVRSAVGPPSGRSCRWHTMSECELMEKGKSGHGTGPAPQPALTSGSVPGGPALLEALPAIHRPGAIGLEWHLGFLPALGTGDPVHLSFSVHTLLLRCYPVGMVPDPPPSLRAQARGESERAKKGLISPPFSRVRPITAWGYIKVSAEQARTGGNTRDRGDHRPSWPDCQGTTDSHRRSSTVQAWRVDAAGGGSEMVDERAGGGVLRVEGVEGSEDEGLGLVTRSRSGRRCSPGSPPWPG